MSRYGWLEELHVEHYNTLYMLAKLLLRQRGLPVEDAGQVVEDAFVQAAEEDIRHRRSPAGWLIKRVMKLCEDRAADRADG